MINYNLFVSYSDKDVTEYTLQYNNKNLGYVVLEKFAAHCTAYYDNANFTTDPDYDEFNMIDEFPTLCHAVEHIINHANVWECMIYKGE